ncbi:MAG TPA: Fic family protein [Longimicrobiales bacterium]|nr:Fic family protein [Longimicrobiales bacterium]
MTADNYHDGSGVLRNLMGITDPRELAEFDLLAGEIYGYAALAFAERQTTLSMDTLCGVHRIIFGELYPWAGKARTVPLFKNNTQFAPPERIPGWLDAVLPGFESALRQRPMDFNQLLAELWGRMNWLHPFPEGNGRATQIFITAVARRHGRDIDWNKVARSDELHAARASITQDFAPYRALLTVAVHPFRKREDEPPLFPDRGR